MSNATVTTCTAKNANGVRHGIKIGKSAAEPHCPSPTCNWCVACYQRKRAECGMR